MSELTITLLRLGYLVLLWLFVLAAISVLRRDLYGTRIVSRRLRRTQRRAPAPYAAPPPQPTAERSAPFPRRDAVPRRLVVTAGPLTGTTLPLGASPVLIGRAASCTLVLDDDYSSSRHARIFPESGQWYVEDLGSTNGTFVGRERVTDPVQVGIGSQVKVGQSILELQR
jgi:pSer/pThr/pTyr-binding forkhead associated (FHA) protein